MRKDRKHRRGNGRQGVAPRSAFTVVAVMVLIVAACTDGGTEVTEGTTAVTAEEAPTTTAETTGTTEETPEEPATTEGTAPDGEAVDSLTIILGSSAFSATYYPLYVAEEQGYFAEEGLTVEIQPGPGSGNAIQQLVAENVETAMSTPAAMLSGIDQGFDLTYVMAHWYEGQFNVLVEEDSGITDFSQLEGQAIGIPELSGSEVFVVEAALLAQGWTPGIDVQLTVVGEGATMLRALQQDQVVAVASNFPNELQLEEELDADLVRITPEEVQFFGDGIAVRTDSLEDGAFREAVVGLVRASIKGRLWSDAHPDDAFAIVKANWSQEQLGDPGDDSYGRPYFSGLLEVTTAEEGVEYGYFEPGSVQNVADFLFELGQLESEIDTENHVDPTVTDEAWEPIDREAVVNEAPNFEVP